QRDDPVGAVVGEDRDAIALREAVIARERAGRTKDAARELAVREAPLALHEEREVAARRRRRDLLAQRALAVLERLHRAPAHRLGDDLERRAGTGEVADHLVVLVCHRAPRSDSAAAPNLPRRRATPSAASAAEAPAASSATSDAAPVRVRVCVWRHSSSPATL